MNSILRKTGGIAAALALSSVASIAQAAYVTTWSYSNTTQFTGVNTFEATGGGTQIELPHQVSWGANGGNVFVNTGNSSTNRSGITIADTPPGGQNDPTVDPVTGTVTTDALSLPGIGLGAWITHHNNPISGSFKALLTSQIQTSLTLTAQTPNPPYPGPATNLPVLDFTVFFSETANTAPCTVTSPTPCNDIFAINFSDAFNQSFTYDGLTYFASIFPIVGGNLGTFQPLSAAACAETGANPGCVGFTTVEGQDTTVRFGFSITGDRIPDPVPEPGSLALIGLGLMGFAAVSRKRRMA